MSNLPRLSVEIKITATCPRGFDLPAEGVYIHPASGVRGSNGRRPENGSMKKPDIRERISTRVPGDFPRFLHYVKPYTWLIVLAALGGIVKFGVPLFIPQVIRHLLDNVLLNPALPGPEKWHQVLFGAGGMILVFVFFYMPWTYVRHYFAGKAGHKSVFDLRTDLYSKIIRMSLSFFKKNRTGEIAARLINDIPQAQNLVGNALTNVWMDAAALVVVLYFLFRIDVATTFVALATFPVYLLFFRNLGREIKESSYNVQKELAEMSGNINEKIAGSVIVHAFTRELAEQEIFQKDSDRLFATTMRTVYLQSVNVTITSVLTQIAPLIVILFGGWQVINGRLTIGELIAVTMYLAPLYLPLQRFSELNVIFANSMSSLRRIFEIMDQEPSIKDRPGAVELKRSRGHIVFDRVSFSFDSRHRVLTEISLEVKPGQKVAVVGPSGSGKSTLVNLVPRFYDPESGSISLDGHDIRDLRIRSLRQRIGLVLQEPIVFSGTLAENILFGNPGADKRQLVAAARSANLYDFVRSLPDGFETEIGERGTLLSGGQKQRITIARAFIKDPDILILDEATSALDAENERLIQDALERLMKRRTTIIIAHRLSTIVHADQILVLHKGTITERGTHDELVRQSKVYRKLYRHQFDFAVKQKP
jgi:subfamily B ATP-binding cassette protein MsbA